MLWVLLGFEAVGGLVIFFMRLAAGETPGELLHICVGAVLLLLYVAYQWTHWSRVNPWRNRLDYVLGLIGATSMSATLLTGYALAWRWWPLRITAHSHAVVDYPTIVSAAHNIMSMLVLTFVGAHLAVVLRRGLRGQRG